MQKNNELGRPADPIAGAGFGHLQELVDELPAAAFAAAEDGALLAANARACALFAVEGPWLRGRPWWGALGPAAGEMGAAWQANAPTGGAFEIAAGGAGRLRVSPSLRDAAGGRAWLVTQKAPPGVDAASSPLAEPSHLAPALNIALQAGGMGLWKWSIDSDAAYWSPELYDLMRLPRGSGIEIGATFLERIVQEDRGACEELVRNLLEAGSSPPVRFRIKAGDGSLRWFVSSAHRVADPDGSACYVGVNFDVTDQVEAEGRLASVKEQRERERSIVDSVLEHVPVGIAVALNGQQDISVVSRHGRDMIEAGEAEGRLWDVWQIYHRDSLLPAKPEEMALHRAARGEVIRDEEWLIRRADGSLLPVICSAGPILGADKEPIGGVVAWHDVTVFKVAHEERQLALAGEKAAREEAEAANKQKDVFLGIVSHELRTPLGAILGWTEIMKRARSQENSERGAAAIERNAQTLARLVDDLLDVTKIAVGKLPMRKRPVDFGQVAHAAFETVQPSALAANVVLERRPLSTAVWLHADPLRLQQAIWNLLANAVKFSSEGGLVLMSEDVENEELVLRVADYGAGIDPESLPHVFDRFWQDAGTSHKAGLGLGLYISRHVAEQHGGSVSADSTGLGRGATFTLRLPLDKGL